MRISAISLFRQLRQYNPSFTGEAPKNYFFVDTNVIIGYREKQYPEMNLEKFIEHPGHQFFYTETTLDELKASGISYPETDPSNTDSSHFKFVTSGITLAHKESTINLLYRMWQQDFSNDKHAIQKGFGLNINQLGKFRKDLFIILEACYSCHAPGVLPDGDFRTPPLITNNMVLLNKFLLRPQATQVLEKAIGLSGLERLVPVQLLSDTTEEWMNLTTQDKQELVLKA